MDVAPTAPADLPPPPAQDRPRRGPGSDPVFGGAAAAVADRLGVDPLWVRVALVVLALLGGVGLVAYAGLWLLLVRGERPGSSWARFAGGVVLVGTVPLYVAATDPGFATGAVAVAALLCGLAVALWAPRTSRPVGAARTPEAPVTAWVAPSPELEPGRARIPRRPRERSPLGRLALGAAVLMAASGALIDEVNGGRLHPEQWLGAGAVVCGVGLLAGAWRGRARGLVVPAALFVGTGFVAGTSAALGAGPPYQLAGDTDVWVGPGSGPAERHVQVFGDIDVEVWGPPTAGPPVQVATSFGDVRIHVAEDVAVELRMRTGHGTVRWFDDAGQQRGENGTLRFGPERPADVVIDARVAYGDITVASFEREPEPPRPPAVVVVEAPAGTGELMFVADGVALAADGTIVLGDGEAVIDPDDTVLAGESHVRPDGLTAIVTGLGEFVVLPRGLLMTPFGTVLDLEAIRASAPAATDGSGADSLPGDPPSSNSSTIPSDPNLED